MNDFIVSCGSTADLSEETAKKRNIAVLPFCFRIGETDYVDDFGKSISNEEFYKLTSGGAKVKTSQISSGRYVEFFEPFLKDGKDVLHVTLSSGLSGTYESCLSAKKELEAKYPERKVYVIDSLCGSMGYGMLVLSAADYRDEGRSAAEIAALLEEDRKKVKAFYFTPDLSAFIRGGRLSPAAGFIGSLLKIVPLLGVTEDGKLFVKKKLIGKKRAISELIAEMKDNAANGTNYDGPCYVCHAACEDDAKSVVTEIEKVFPSLKGKCVISEIGPTMGAHCGASTVAVFFES